jgi:hypothetical protein
MISQCHRLVFYNTHKITTYSNSWLIVELIIFIFTEELMNPKDPYTLYANLHKIGEGAFGDVWEAYDTVHNRKVMQYHPFYHVWLSLDSYIVCPLGCHKEDGSHQQK